MKKRKRKGSMKKKEMNLKSKRKKFQVKKNESLKKEIKRVKK